MDTAGKVPGYKEDDEQGCGQGDQQGDQNGAQQLAVSPDDLQTLGASSLWLYRSQVQTPFMLSSDKKTDSVICCRALFNQGSGQLDYAF